MVQSPLDEEKTLSPFIVFRGRPSSIITPSGQTHAFNVGADDSWSSLTAMDIEVARPEVPPKDERYLPSPIASSEHFSTPTTAYPTSRGRTGLDNNSKHFSDARYFV